MLGNRLVLKQTNNAAHASKANTKPNKIILLFESHPTSCTFRFFSFVSKLMATTPLSSSSNFVIWFSIVEEVMAVTSCACGTVSCLDKLTHIRYEKYMKIEFYLPVGFNTRFLFIHKTTYICVCVFKVLLVNPKGNPPCIK